MTETYSQRWRREHRPGRPGKIESDPEVKAFVDANLPRMTFRELARACRDKFGAARAPGRSAVHRYWQSRR